MKDVYPIERLASGYYGWCGIAHRDLPGLDRYLPLEE